jgi:hypothetical protein
MIYPLPSAIPESKITAPVDAGVHTPSQSLILTVEDRMGTKLLDESYEILSAPFGCSFRRLG